MVGSRRLFSTLQIGLEVHAQLATRHKLFSPALISHNDTPNVDVDPFDMAYPGILPVLNRDCVRLAIRAALLFGCTINECSQFDRKHYQYHDLPHGYQITQERIPIAINGRLGGVEIERIQLEMDSAKSIQLSNQVGIDLNRAGVGLIEIVTGPSMTEASEAVEFAKSLRECLQDAAICTGEMEAGHLRFDVNVSVIKGQRVEIKNLNSFAHLREAIEYERGRQTALLKAGETVARETRGWDPRAGVTTPLRIKQPDYRFMPEYDLPLLIVSEQEIQAERSLLPESRAKRLERWGIGAQANIILEAGLAGIFEEAIRDGVDRNLAANWLTVDYLGVHSRRTANAKPLQPAEILSLLKQIASQQMTAYAAKGVLVNSLWHGKPFSPPHKVSLDWQQVVREVVEGQPDMAWQMRNGQRQVDYFMGPIMKRLRGSVDPQLVRSFLSDFIQQKMEI